MTQGVLKKSDLFFWMIATTEVAGLFFENVKADLNQTKFFLVCTVHRQVTTKY